MAVQARAKGNRTERRAMAWLAERGYLVAKVAQKHKRAAGDFDAFGLFDLIAVHPKHPPLFVQVKSNTARDHQAYMDFTAIYQCCAAQLVWYDRLGWVCHDYDGGNHETTDFRRKKVVPTKKRAKAR